jgi:nucleotide-binding universal stress UspA family protein
MAAPAWPRTVAAMSTGTSNLVVGYDGSPASAEAVRWAAERARGGGRLVVVHARRPGIPPPATAESRTRARAAFDALWTESELPLHLEVELRVTEDAPAHALVRAAREVGAEGIVVGRHHEGPFSSDIVRQLLRETDRPVTVVP